MAPDSKRCLACVRTGGRAGRRQQAVCGGVAPCVRACQKLCVLPCKDQNLPSFGCQRAQPLVNILPRLFVVLCKGLLQAPESFFWCSLKRLVATKEGQAQSVRHAYRQGPCGSCRSGKLGRWGTRGRGAERAASPSLHRSVWAHTLTMGLAQCKERPIRCLCLF